jgi:hypothetical protein
MVQFYCLALCLFILLILQEVSLKQIVLHFEGHLCYAFWPHRRIYIQTFLSDIVKACAQSVNRPFAQSLIRLWQSVIIAEVVQQQAQAVDVLLRMSLTPVNLLWTPFCFLLLIHRSIRVYRSIIYTSDTEILTMKLICLHLTRYTFEFIYDLEKHE